MKDVFLRANCCGLKAKKSIMVGHNVRERQIFIFFHAQLISLSLSF